MLGLPMGDLLPGMSWEEYEERESEMMRRFE
jgi:hypothetical protein